MEFGMLGLGRTGANITKRLARGGHRVVGFDPKSKREAVARGRAGERLSAGAIRPAAGVDMLVTG